MTTAVATTTMLVSARAAAVDVVAVLLPAPRQSGGRWGDCTPLRRAAKRGQREAGRIRTTMAGNQTERRRGTALPIWQVTPPSSRQNR